MMIRPPFFEVSLRIAMACVPLAWRVVSCPLEHWLKKAYQCHFGLLWGVLRLLSVCMVLSMGLTGTLFAQSSPSSTGIVLAPIPAWVALAMRLVPEEQLESEAQRDYAQITLSAQMRGALVSSLDERVLTLRRLTQRLIKETAHWNASAAAWRWEVNLVSEPQINAFCMPGGKVVVYTGLLQTLGLSQDELAVVLGHEMAHALREHSRQRMAKGLAAQGVSRGVGVVASGVLGVDPRLTDRLAMEGANLWTLKFSREEETEADLVGLDLAARAGFDPRAGLTLWRKMAQTNSREVAQWLSTHPSHENRLREIERHLPQVMPLFEHAQHLERVQTYHLDEPQRPSAKP
jgi:predicted Zn-dependent protease